MEKFTVTAVLNNTQEGEGGRLKMCNQKNRVNVQIIIEKKNTLRKKSIEKHNYISI